MKLRDVGSNTRSNIIQASSIWEIQVNKSACGCRKSEFDLKRVFVCLCVCERADGRRHLLPCKQVESTCSNAASSQP